MSSISVASLIWSAKGPLLLAVNPEALMELGDIRRTLTEIADLYPSDVRARKLAAIPRLAFQVEKVFRPQSRLLDLGSGVSMMPLACQRMGMTVTIVDDFGDPINQDPDTRMTIDLFRDEGVTVWEADGVTFDPGDQQFDVVSTFDSLEHWHHSPRPTLERCVAALRPGGVLVISVPNAVRLTARLNTLRGKSTWSSWQSYWTPETFRSHVREWTVSELYKAAKHLGLQVETVYGRSWAFPQPVARLIDRRPTLSREITLVARKP